MSKAQNSGGRGRYFCVGGNILQLGNSKHRMSLGLVSLMDPIQSTACRPVLQVSLD